jgi:hypothetical protein
MNDGGAMAVSPLNPNYVFCTGNLYPGSEWNIAISHSSDGGTTWDHDTITYGSNGLAVAFDPFDTNRVYVAGDSAYNYSYSQFLVSTDLGETWTPSHSGLRGRVWTIAADPVQSGVVYCGTYLGVYKSTDAGATWNGTALTRDTRTLVLDPTNPAVLYAGTGSDGVFTTTDGGTTWAAMNTGLGCTKILSLALRPGTGNVLFAGTDGGAVYRTDILTGVSDRPAFDTRNSSFDITPNPCRGLASIRLNPGSLDPLNPRILSVFDAAGRRVITTPMTAAVCELNTAGLAPGNYFVRLSGPEPRLARLTVTE